eukprot:m.33129 g.33129  ORF g.33129 m.33129 type:complete len:159 (-) comp5075_c0_seq1:173-649(-)
MYHDDQTHYHKDNDSIDDSHNSNHHHQAHRYNHHQISDHFAEKDNYSTYYRHHDHHNQTHHLNDGESCDNNSDSDHNNQKDNRFPCFTHHDSQHCYHQNLTLNCSNNSHNQKDYKSNHVHQDHDPDRNGRRLDDTNSPDHPNNPHHKSLAAVGHTPAL